MIRRLDGQLKELEEQKAEMRKREEVRDHLPVCHLRSSH